MNDARKPLSPLTMLARGITGRCPLCGGGHLRRRWFGLVERCPTCGHRYSRGGDQALALGGYMIQIIFVFGGLLLLMFVYIAKYAGAAGLKDVSFTWFVVAAAIIIVAGTLGLYPFTKMLWVAIDLGMQPPSMIEQANAALYKAEGKEAADRAFNEAMGVEAARKREARRRRGAEGAAADQADEQLAIDIAAGRRSSPGDGPESRGTGGATATDRPGTEPAAPTGED